MEPNENIAIPFPSISIEKDHSQLAFDMKETQCHPFYELYFLLSGERRYFIGNEIYNVSPGNLVVVPKNEIHKTGALNKKGYDRYVMYFSDEAVQDLIKHIGEQQFSRFVGIGCWQFPPEQVIKIKGKMDRIFAEETLPDNLSYATKKCLLYDLIITSLRFGTKKQCATSDGADKIQLVARYITENYASEISLSDAAGLACMEKTYFSKRFKALTGFGFSTYLMQTRINAAKSLLISTDMTVSEVSDACGFSSSNYFGDAFLRATDLSPSEFRKKNKY